MEDKINNLHLKPVNVKAWGGRYKCLFTVSKYKADNSPAVSLVIAEDHEPFCTLTCCLPGTILEKDEILVKTWSENAPITEELLKLGLFKDTWKEVTTGFCAASIWKVL